MVNLERKLLGHKASIYALHYVEQSEELLSAGGDGWIVAWPHDRDVGKLIAEVEGQLFSVRQTSFAGLIAAGSMDGDLYLIDRDGERAPRKKIFHKKGIFDIIELGGRIITAGGDGKIGFWDPESAEIEESILISHERLRSLSLSPDRKTLAVGSSDGKIYLFDTVSWSAIAVISAHEKSVFSTLWLGNDEIVSGGRDAHLKRWSLQDLTYPFQDLPAHWYTVNAIAVHPKGDILATASRDKTIRLWDTGSLTLLRTLDAAKSEGHLNSVNDLTWDATGETLYGASDDRSISVWKFEKGIA